jgi:DNA repair protein RecN (Recombination protein N)
MQVILQQFRNNPSMLTLLSISNIALIDELRVEFDHGLNLLTGETGSGKSIIVDALGVLIGGRFTSDLLKTGAERASIEGLFSVVSSPELETLLSTAGIVIAHDAQEKQDAAYFELIIRRELSTSGRNKIFINNQLATQALLRGLRPFLVDIHGQGDQQTLFDADTHLELLDSFAGATVVGLRQEVSKAFVAWSALKRELESLRADETEKFQLADILKFQIAELERAELAIGEDSTLEEERRRLSNVEKLTLLSAETYGLVYDDKDAALTRVGLALKQVEELAGFESSFRDYLEGLQQARSVLEDLAFALRDFSDKLEFSPSRFEQIGNRLAEISSIKRKYGGSIDAALEHLARSEDRLRQIDHADERETEIKLELDVASAAYLERATRLHQERTRAAKKFERAVEQGLGEVAMENAKFQIQITSPEADAENKEGSSHFTARGIDQVDFYFSANVGEDVKPLAKVASGGEASRLMLVLKTVANASEFPRTIVFDEIDSGIGGRVSEAVGAKLKKLSLTNQVLCVTHQAQIARFADSHLLVTKETVDRRTEVNVASLDRRARVEEIARMLTGAEITDSARRHARELLKS